MTISFDLSSDIRFHRGTEVKGVEYVKYHFCVLCLWYSLCSLLQLKYFPLPNNIIVPFMLSWMIWVVGIDSKKEKHEYYTMKTPYVLFLCPKQ